MDTGIWEGLTEERRCVQPPCGSARDPVTTLTCSSWELVLDLWSEDTEPNMGAVKGPLVSLWGNFQVI